MTQPLALHDPQVRTISVLLVCNERVISAALRALIDGQDGMTVVGEVDRTGRCDRRNCLCPS